MTSIQAFRNAYLLIATPLAGFSSYRGYKESNSYLRRHPKIPNDDRLTQEQYELIVRGGYTTTYVAAAYAFPITLPLFYYYQIHDVDLQE